MVLNVSLARRVVCICYNLSLVSTNFPTFHAPSMSSTRSSRSAGAPLDVVDHLSARERLLVAQAVYEYGSNAWLDISKVLSKHPLITRPKGFFSPQVNLAAISYLCAMI